MTGQEIRRKLRGIPGLMTSSETDVLIRMARSAGVIVDLGVYKGHSMAAMMLSNSKAKVYGVDSFGDMGHRGYKGSTEAECRKNLKKLGLTPAGIFAMTTGEAAKQFQDEIDLLHVDAGHSREEVQADIDNWLPKVVPGGAVIFHDYGRAHKRCLDRPEVQEVVDDWRNPQWTEVERAGVSIAFRNLIADDGVLYVAYGEKARDGVARSASSLRKFMPEIPIAVVADVAVQGYDYWIQHPDLSLGARNVKTRMFSLSPWERTLYLDADTIVRSSANPSFRLLDFFDIVMGIDPNKILSKVTWRALDPKEVAATKSDIGTGEVQYYNSGAILFRRNGRLREFFQEWHAQWLRWQKQDQLAFIRALYRHPVRIAPMREPWNTYKRGIARFVWHRHRTVARSGAPG